MGTGRVFTDQPLNRTRVAEPEMRREIAKGNSGDTILNSGNSGDREDT